MDEISVKLSQLFEKGFQIQEELRVTTLPTNDTKFQNKVLEAMKALEESTQLVNELSLFSSNESVEEIATNNLKYLLLPALLADLTLRCQTIERSEVLKTAEIYFNDFIQRLNDYQICDIDVKRADSSSSGATKTTGSSMISSLESAVHNRNDKIFRYKAMKEMENKLNEMKQKMSQMVNDIDDEILREYYLTLLKRWINCSLDELQSIETEKPILDHLKQMKSFGKDKQSVKTTTKSNTSRLKPIIITRNEMQKKVYGLGYPSIPTVSVDDFINQKLDEGSLAITDPSIYNNSLLDWAQNPDQKRLEDEGEEERKEILKEWDDSQELKRDRNWDEWKDDHKRGEGNRKNMG